MPGYAVMEGDKEFCIHNGLLGLLLCHHRGISLPVELLKPPLACGRQSFAKTVVVHPGHGAGRGYRQYGGGLAKVDISDVGA